MKRCLRPLKIISQTSAPCVSVNIKNTNPGEVNFYVFPVKTKRNYLQYSMVTEFHYSKIKGRGLPVYYFADGEWKKKYILKDLSTGPKDNIYSDTHCYDCKEKVQTYFLQEVKLSKGLYRYRIFCDLCFDDIFNLIY